MEKFEFADQVILFDSKRNPYVFIGDNPNIYDISAKKYLCQRPCDNCKKYKFWAPWDLLKPILESEEPQGVEMFERLIERNLLKEKFMEDFENYYEKHRKK